MAQYAQDFQKYLHGQGKSANGNGDYQKYMSDFQQYMKGQGGSHGDYQKYMSMYAADFDKYQKQYSKGQGGCLPAGQFRIWDSLPLCLCTLSRMETRTHTCTCK